MLYEFRCECGSTRTEIRPMNRRDRPAICHNCNGKMTRLMGSFSYVGGNPNPRRLAPKERREWALATGERIETAHDIDRWAKSHGKEIVGRGFTPKKPNYDAEIERDGEKALDSIYAQNHNAGTVTTKGETNGRRKSRTLQKASSRRR